MCDDCNWQDYEDLADRLADKGSRFAQRLIDEWFGEEGAEHVTERQVEALERVAAEFGEEL